MREPTPDERPVVVSVAGSDAGGGAGIQADVKTAEACGAFGTSVVTSVTAQNTQGVESTHVLPIAEVDAQLDAVFDDFDVAAVKTGMLATTEIVERVADRARETACPFVVDPVMVAASGDRLLAPEAESAYEELIAEATLVTPNADEAAVLTGVDPETADDLRAVGEKLVDAGADAALVKGGHVAGDPVRDMLVRGDGGGFERETFTHPRVDTEATHGSGCTLSSAIAAELAVGESTTTAVERGVDLLARAVRYPLDVGEGPGAVHHTVGLRNDVARGQTREWATTVTESAAGGGRVAVATPYAEGPSDVAVGGDDGVQFGRDDPLVETLLAVRERGLDRRVAVAVDTVGTADAVDAADAGDDWTVAERVEQVDAETDALADGDGVVVLGRDAARARELLDGV
jgi:hydroxymethylpyrimidine/phosphomethylpyrimidine kinase